MKKITTIIAAFVFISLTSLLITSCKTTGVTTSTSILKGKKVQFSGPTQLTVKIIAKRGKTSLVQFKEITGQFAVKNCEWKKGDTVTVNF